MVMVVEVFFAAGHSADGSTESNRLCYYCFSTGNATDFGDPVMQSGQAEIQEGNGSNGGGPEVLYCWWRLPFSLMLFNILLSQLPANTTRFW